jgi:hypothetical protein
MPNWWKGKPQEAGAIMFHRGHYLMTIVPALLVGLGAAVASDAARADWQSGTFAAVCAAKEIKVITLIEDHGAAADVAPERLGDAGLAMLRARLACYEGRVAEAVALYDEILSLGPVVAAAQGQ